MSASEGKAVSTLPTPGGYAWFTRYERRHIGIELPSQTWNQGTTMEAGEILSQWLSGRCHQQAFTEWNVCSKHRVTEKCGSQRAWAREDSVIRSVAFIVPGWLLWRLRAPSWGRQDKPLLIRCLVLRMTELWTMAWFSQQVVMGRIWVS